MSDYRRVQTVGTGGAATKRSDAGPRQLVFSWGGQLQAPLTPVEQSGRFTFLEDTKIDALLFSLTTAGTSGSTIVTVYKNGTALTTLTLTVNSHVIIDRTIRQFVENDYVTVALTTVDTTAKDAVLQMRVAA